MPVAVTDTRRGELADVTKYVFPFEAATAVSANKTVYSLGTPVLSASGVSGANQVFMGDVRGERLEDT
jgi:hypothetical protein